MRTIDSGSFVQIRFDRARAVLEFEEMTDAQIKEGLAAARVNPHATVRPPVETVLHATIYHLGKQCQGADVKFAGHTHPTGVNAILSSVKAQEAIAGRLFPDEIVYCGPAPVYIPYIDPGLPLARAVRDAISELTEHSTCGSVFANGRFLTSNTSKRKLCTVKSACSYGSETVP